MKKAISIMVVMFLLTFTVFAAYFDVGAGLTYDSFSFVEKVKVEGGETTETKMPYDTLGVNIAGTYWFTDTLGVEASFDFAKGDVINMSLDLPISFLLNGSLYFSDVINMSSDLLSIKAKASSQLIGLSVAVKYMVLKSPVFVNVKAGAGYYFYNSTNKVTITFDGTTFEETSKMKGNGFGMLVGAEMLHPVTNSLAIKANAGYKLFTNIKTNIKNLKDQDDNELTDATISMNGLKLGFGVMYSF